VKLVVAYSSDTKLERIKRLSDGVVVSQTPGAMEVSLIGTGHGALSAWSAFLEI
jgi:hypothetical protein